MEKITEASNYDHAVSRYETGCNEPVVQTEPVLALSARNEAQDNGQKVDDSQHHAETHNQDTSGVGLHHRERRVGYAEFEP